MKGLNAYAYQDSRWHHLRTPDGRPVVVEVGMNEKGEPVTGSVRVRIRGFKHSDTVKFRKTWDTQNAGSQLTREAAAEQRGIETLASCILEWQNFVVDGSELEATHGEKVRILKDPRFDWIVADLTHACQDEQAFLGNG